MYRDTSINWTPEFLAQWVKDRQAGLQQSSDIKTYEQQKFGITYHFAWVLGLDWGEKDNFTKTDYLLRDHSKVKCFDYPYLLTTSAQNGGWVRYQLLPASMYDHSVHPVYEFIDVNDNEEFLKIWGGDFVCINCWDTGTEAVLQMNPCHCHEQDHLGDDNISSFKRMCRQHLIELRKECLKEKHKPVTPEEIWDAWFETIIDLNKLRNWGGGIKENEIRFKNQIEKLKEKMFKLQKILPFDYLS